MAVTRNHSASGWFDRQRDFERPPKELRIALPAKLFKTRQDGFPNEPSLAALAEILDGIAEQLQPVALSS